MKKKKILFVCLGNICRSPLAKALFLQALSDAGAEDLFEVDSCGTNGQHDGEEADPRTRNNAASHGISIDHRSRKITPMDLDYFDLVLVMDENNRRTVELLCTTSQQRLKIKKLRAFDPLFPMDDVGDPWFGGEAGFELTYHILQENTALWVQRLLPYPR